MGMLCQLRDRVDTTQHNALQMLPHTSDIIVIPKSVLRG